MKNVITLLSLLCLASCSSMKNTFVGAEVGAGFYSVTEAIEGRQSGVLFNSSPSNPELSPSLLIRGINSINASTEPLYIVDGMTYNSPLNMLNPSDIESVKVLKDPSETSIYGIRGGNGVVVIKTKKGGAKDR